MPTQAQTQLTHSHTLGLTDKHTKHNIHKISTKLTRKIKADKQTSIKYLLQTKQMIFPVCCDGGREDGVKAHFRLNIARCFGWDTKLLTSVLWHEIMSIHTHIYIYTHTHTQAKLSSHNKNKNNKHKLSVCTLHRQMSKNKALHMSARISGCNT